MFKCQPVVDLMNSAGAADAQAIRDLIAARVPCNDAMLNHPTIQCGYQNDDQSLPAEVGMLGILNGIVAEMSAGQERLYFITDDDPAVPVQFAVATPETHPTWF